MQTMIVTRFNNQIKKPDANHDCYQINKCMGMNNQSSAMHVPKITEEDSKSTRVELNCIEQDIIQKYKSTMPKIAARIFMFTDSTRLELNS